MSATSVKEMSATSAKEVSGISSVDSESLKVVMKAAGFASTRRLRLMIGGLIASSLLLMLCASYLENSFFEGRRCQDALQKQLETSMSETAQYRSMGDEDARVDHHALRHDIDSFVPRHVIYPPSVFNTSLAEPIALVDLLHQAMLHEACMKHTDSIIMWTYARNSSDTSSHHLIDQDDPNLIDKVRQCPDVDIFHPKGLRGHGYCEDSVAYLKYLESRLLPQWVLEMTFEDKVTKRKFRYHDLCPKTPVIMFNHYWFNEREDWPKDKKIYVMPNIEMGQLQSSEYWSVDAVLCKTAICARRVRKWFKQQGNPRNASVFYTRHSSADIATLAKFRAGESVVKDYSQVRFAHASGGSPFKGTDKIFECWMARPDFPPLKIVIDKGRYNDAYRAHYEQLVRDSNGRVQVHVDGMNGQEYGTLLAETSFFLCPSTMEGYGHYLNQVRAASAVIVSTDLAPMNEFLTPASGVLIPVTRRTHKDMIMSGGFHGENGLKEDEGGLIAEFSAVDLCDAVERLLKLSVAEREAMGTLARKQYHIDTRYFAAKMRELRTFAIVEGGRSEDY